MNEFGLDRITSLATAASCTALARGFGRAIGADRCFLYVRDPHGRRGQIAALWRRTSAVPDLPEDSFHGLEPEADALFTDDPMFKAALAGHPVTCVDDVLNAGGLVNAAFEKTYNHRALIHLNFCADGQLWAVLQPAMSHSPRIWNAADMALAETTRQKFTPLMKAALECGDWREAPERTVGGEAESRWPANEG